MCVATNNVYTQFYYIFKELVYMKVVLSILAALAIVSGSATAQSTKWKEDASHTTIGFSVKHLVISTVTGKFNDYSISVLSDKPDFSDAKVEVKIKTKSINTENAKRDEHLRSADFFDAEKFGEITFISKKLVKTGNNTFKITGDLTMKGITKTVTLDAEFGGIATAWGTTKAGLSLSGVINRFDYGLSWNKVVEAGGMVVSDNVKLVIDVELDKVK